MKVNLKINKEIIEGLFKSSNANEKDKLYGGKLREENELLSRRLQKLKNELEDARNKIGHYEKMMNDSILEYRDSTESLANKVFILENAMSKKDNMLFTMNCKVEKLQKFTFTQESEYVKEIFVMTLLISILR